MSGFGSVDNVKFIIMKFCHQDASLVEEVPKDESDGSARRNQGGRNVSCFNCQNNHNIRSCPFPVDYDRVAMNKRRSQILSGGARYHGTKSLVEEFPDIRPGHPSRQLRDALGLRKNDLPPYVYRMRVYGYPPGWMLAAKVVQKRVEVYTEDGEAEDDVQNTKIDPRKIISYPGFNVPIPPGVTDVRTIA